MKNFNLLSKSSSQSCSHSSATLAATVGSPSVHRRGTMLKLLSVLVLIFTLGIGQMWADSYTITFANNASSATAISSTVNASTTIANDGSRNYVTTQPYTVNSGNCYYGDTHTCIRIGKSGKSSSLSIALSTSGQVYATTIVVNANNPNNSSNSNCKLNVNGAGEQTTTGTANNYTFTINNNITSITLTGDKSIYIYSITVNYSSTKVATPTFSVAAGTYNESKSVTLLSCSTAGATIRYTLDGSTPTSTSTAYSSAITVAESKTIKAKAFKSGLTDSDMATATYTIKCATPTFSVNAGTYNESKSVTLSTTYGTKIYYTTNGSNPTTSSTEYTGAITVSKTTTIKAIAWKSGCTNSEIASRTYTIQCATPTFSVNAGTYNESKSVTLSTTYGDKIYYTTNNTTPSTSSTLYEGAIAVSANTTIKAIAWKEGCSNSDIASATYTLQCVAPTFDVAAGTHTGAQTVTISSTTPGVTIRYTTNGTYPTTTTGTVYSEPITVSSSQTVKAIAYKENWSASTVVSAAYTIQYYITWNDNGGQIGNAVLVNSGNTNYTCPSDLSLEERGNCGNRFMGWTNTSGYAGNEPPTILFTNSTGSKPAVNSNMDFYAVFADYAE